MTRRIPVATLIAMCDFCDIGFEGALQLHAPLVIMKGISTQ